LIEGQRRRSAISPSGLGGSATRLGIATGVIQFGLFKIVALALGGPQIALPLVPAVLLLSGKRLSHGNSPADLVRPVSDVGDGESIDALNPPGAAVRASVEAAVLPPGDECDGLATLRTRADLDEVAAVVAGADCLAGSHGVSPELKGLVAVGCGGGVIVAAHAATQVTPSALSTQCVLRHQRTPGPAGSGPD